MALAHSDDDDRNDRVTFREERDGSVTAFENERIGRPNLGMEGDDYEIPVWRGDEYVANDETTPPPTVMKIDVDGGEKKVIEGLEGLLSECRLLYVEVHPTDLPSFGSSEEEFLSKIESLGFNFEVFEGYDGSNRYQIKAQREI